MLKTDEGKTLLIRGYATNVLPVHSCCHFLCIPNYRNLCIVNFRLQPFMSAFGGLEVGAAGVIIYSLINKSAFFDNLVPWACLLLVVLKVVEIILQIKASEPFAAMVGPLVVLVLVVGFYLLRQSI